MLVEVRVPQLSESVSEATLLTWHKKPGDFVQRDENLIDIETDKVVLELPAPEAGVLTGIVKAEGGTVVSNEIIATIDTEAKATAAAPAAPAPPAAFPPGPVASPAVNPCPGSTGWCPRAAVAAPPLPSAPPPARRAAAGG